jgi:hypothetical protein
MMPSISTTCLQILFLLTIPRSLDAILREAYTSNKACTARRCVNPVFPGLPYLPVLEKKTWTKQSVHKVSKLVNFCDGIVNYDVALPNETASAASLLQASNSSKNTSKGAKKNKPLSLEEIVEKQEQEALTMYFYHLSAIGYEPWDFPKPMQATGEHAECIKSVAKMVCFTYFPAAVLGVGDGDEVRYHRPCGSHCENYVNACGVECCDDSTTCTWKASASEQNLAKLDTTISDAASASTTDADDEPRKTQTEMGEDVLLFTGYTDEQTGRCTGAQN